MSTAYVVAYASPRPFVCFCSARPWPIRGETLKTPHASLPRGQGGKVPQTKTTPDLPRSRGLSGLLRPCIPPPMRPVVVWTVARGQAVMINASHRHRTPSGHLRRTMSGDRRPREKLSWPRSGPSSRMIMKVMMTDVDERTTKNVQSCVSRLPLHRWLCPPPPPSTTTSNERPLRRHSFHTHTQPGGGSQNLEEERPTLAAHPTGGPKDVPPLFMGPPSPADHPPFSWLRDRPPCRYFAPPLPPSVVAPVSPEEERSTPAAHPTGGRRMVLPSSCGRPLREALSALSPHLG